MTSVNAPELPMIFQRSFTREYALCAEKQLKEILAFNHKTNLLDACIG